MFTELEQHYKTYKANREHAHRLFEECLAFAKHITDIDNPDRLDIAYDAAWQAWEKFDTIPSTTVFAVWLLQLVKRTQRAYILNSDITPTPDGHNTMNAEKLVEIAEQLQRCGEQLLNAGNKEGHKVLANVNILIEESRRVL